MVPDIHAELVKEFEINNQQLYQKFLNRESFVIVDVRMPDLYAESDFIKEDHFEKLHIPYMEFKDNYDQAVARLPKDREIIFVCRTGRKTRYVSDRVRGTGLNFRYLKDGIHGWQNFFDQRPVLEYDDDGIYQLSRPGRGDLSYVLLSDGQAALFDPMRETQRYLTLAEEHEAVITHIFDTHNHADRITGAPALSKITGAAYYRHPYDAIYLVEAVPIRHDYEPLRDGSVFKVGQFDVRAIWFPGHTLGMTMFLLTDPRGKTSLITGDGIFIASIGRPDLLGKGDRWASILYHSLQTRLEPFVHPDTLILPAHFQLFSEQNGGGIYTRSYTVLKQENPMLRDWDEASFTERILDEIPKAPESYYKILQINAGLMAADEEEMRELETGKNLCSIKME